jgi:peptidoglycan hydrolase CwlO-like protein
MVAQLEKERETRHALQEQCAFLGQEVFKLETELKHQKLLVEEQKNKILERASSAASSPGSRSYIDFNASAR